MDDSNFFTVQGWMVNKLDLSGYELSCFAIIYGFSQDGESKFEGSLNYISSFLKCSIKTAQRSIERLLEKNFIYLLEKGKSKQNPSIYRSNVRYTDGKIIYINSTIDKMTIVKKSNDSGQNVHTTMDKMSTNNNKNKYINNYEEKDISSVSSDISKEKKQDIENIPLVSKEKTKKRFSGVNPSKEEVEAYIKEKSFHVSADRVISYYTNNGDYDSWRFKDGSLVRDWKRCVITCESNWKEKARNKSDAIKDRLEESSFYAELTRQEREKDKEKSEEYIAKYGKLFEAI